MEPAADLVLVRQFRIMRPFLIRSLLFAIAHGIIAFVCFVLYQRLLMPQLVGEFGHRITMLVPTAHAAIYFYTLNILLFPFSALWLFHILRPVPDALLYPLWCINSFLWGM